MGYTRNITYRAFQAATRMKACQVASSKSRIREGPRKHQPMVDMHSHFTGTKYFPAAPMSRSNRENRSKLTCYAVHKRTSRSQHEFRTKRLRRVAALDPWLLSIPTLLIDGCFHSRTKQESQYRLALSRRIRCSGLPARGLCCSLKQTKRILRCCGVPLVPMRTRDICGCVR